MAARAADISTIDVAHHYPEIAVSNAVRASDGIDGGHSGDSLIALQAERNSNAHDVRPDSNALDCPDGKAAITDRQESSTACSWSMRVLQRPIRIKA